MIERQGKRTDMKKFKLLGAIALFLSFFVSFGGALAAAPLPTPTPTPSLAPGALPINGVTVEVVSPGAHPANNASHVEVPPLFKKK